MMLVTSPTHGRQLKHLDLDERTVSLLGKLTILDRLVPEIVRPIHIVTLAQRGKQSTDPKRQHRPKMRFVSRG